MSDTNPEKNNPCKNVPKDVSERKNLAGRPRKITEQQFVEYLEKINFFWDPKPNTHIAHELKISEGTVRNLRRKVNR